MKNVVFSLVHDERGMDSATNGYHQEKPKSKPKPKSDKPYEPNIKKALIIACAKPMIIGAFFRILSIALDFCNPQLLK